MDRSPLELDLARLVIMDGIGYMVEGRQGSNLSLFNTLTGETLTMTYSAVMRRIGLSEIPLDNIDAVRAAGAKPVELSKWRMTFKDHIEEVAYGKPHGAMTYRPEYDPNTTNQKERLDRKASDLAGSNMPGTSRSNLKKLVCKLKRRDSTGLVDGRSHRVVDPFANIDPRLYKMMIRRIDRARNESTPTTEQLITEVRVDWIQTYPRELSVLPSNRTLRRKFHVLTEHRDTTGSAKNRRSHESAPKRQMAGRPAFAPGEEIQIDSTVLDLLVRGDKGELFRPNLTTFIDKATHTVTAAMLTKRVKGVDLAYLLAKSLSIPETRPGPKLPYNLNEVRTLPWAEALVDQELEGKDTGRPIIVPRRLIMDNGLDYQSDAFLLACRGFCIDVTNAAPGTGSDKAIVERLNRTIKDLFARNLPGFTGGSPDTRGRKIEQQAGLLSIFTVAWVLDLWLRHVWQNLETRALRNPEHPAILYSPNTMYEALTYRTGCLFVPIHPDTYVSLLSVVDRVIGPMGITIGNRWYDSRMLGPYRGQPSGDKLTGDLWRVRYDPNNPAVVWVRIPTLDRFPDAGSYIECPWVNSDAFDSPFSRAIREMAEAARQYGFQIPEKERGEASRLFVKSVSAAAEKEFREAQEREAKERLDAQQGVAHARPRIVEEPRGPSEVWADAGHTGAYEIFDPESYEDDND
ncbi:Mu transposase C-terminal domain-containing protein [Pseudarthrobacter sp. NBSH8]|uniref:Mu transposase C-terminal domain-containing protein n=1 Tax=Pseudarthrobacter sp. NBSH8 TaxID=2596911 RepID=UPI0016298C09|nr:Mu transposase C-terminal domain-containing protein [Pseudarthrobacter sp. NBSH8]